MVLVGAWASTCTLLLLLQRGLRGLRATPCARRCVLGGALILILAVWGWQREILVPHGAGIDASEQLLTGDEPDYLLTALSLARDGDFDVHNNIVGHDHLAFQNRPIGGLAFEEFNRIAKGRLERRRAQWGEAQFTPHRPGTSLVLVPVFLLAGGNYRWWACFEFALLAAVMLLVLLMCFLRLGAPLHLALIGVLFSALSPPMHFYSCQIYPEILLGGLLAVSAALLFFPGRPSMAGAVLLAAAIWFSDRALPAVALLSAATVWRQDDRRRRVIALAVLGVSTLGFAAYCMHRFGVPWPVHHNERSGFSWVLLPARMFQILFDRQQGWVWLFPAVVLLPAIAWDAWKDRGGRSAVARGATWGALALTLALVAVFDDWRGGVNPRGRYYVLPQWLFMVLLLDWLRGFAGRNRNSTRVFIALGALSVCTLPWLLYHPNWWFRRYHPLFGWPPLARFYGWLPDLPDAAPLVEWGKAACWVCVALLPFFLVRRSSSGGRGSEAGEAAGQ